MRHNIEKQISDYVTANKEIFYRLAYSYVKNPEDALDIVQESIYKALSSINILKESSKIKTWFYRIVVNTSLDLLRKRKRLVPLEEEPVNDLERGEFDYYEDLDLQEALDALPESCRVIIILRYFEDLKIDEIAEVLNENVNTIKTRLYKSLKKLRIEIGEDYHEK